ncbi:2-hydroxyacyl-CoA dehydratase subunit D [Slackia isoflavoniconvertens]|uniref:2-hydroxyacyl-CoA dehydratase subunit D n=1 Tax=Slackia isoflavoniconvertens TaxID=572010 RepID=UPI003AACEC20
MAALEEMLEELGEVSRNPKKQLDAYIAAGKRVIGVGPYYAPEELVHAAGAIPFGVWGCMGTAEKAKRYFPPFYCSICQMTLEMGLDGTLGKLSGMMVTTLCDTLKAFSQNWKAGVKGVPMIFVSQPQNRHTPFGREFAIESYAGVRTKVEECCGAIIDDASLAASNKLYNQWRQAMREFVVLAGMHPAEVSNAARVAVVNAGYFMDKAEHLEKVRAINDLLAKLPESTEGYKKIELVGIYEDIPAITEILDAHKYAVVSNDLAKESRAFSMQIPEEGDPLEALADAWCAVENDSLLYDPQKKHVSHVVDQAKQSGACGVVILLAKFCDPEEFEAPLVTRAVKAAGLPVITIEVDQQTESYEQAATQLETFAEMIG